MRERRQHSGIFALAIALLILGAPLARAEDEGYAPPPVEPTLNDGQMDPTLSSQLIYPPPTAEGAAATPMVFSTATSLFKTRVPRIPRKIAAAPAPSPIASNLTAEITGAEETEVVEQEAAPAPANAPVADRGLLSQVETEEAKRIASDHPASAGTGASSRLLQAVKRAIPR